MTNSSADVVILGGGPAGSATALALAGQGISVVLLERTANLEGVRVGETLPPRSRTALHSLGVWEAFQRDDHLPSGGITSVWGSDIPQNSDFIFDPYGCGWHLDRGRFDKMLLEAAERAGARVFYNARMLDCIKEKKQPILINATISNKPITLHSSFLVDATGRASLVVRNAGGTRNSYDRLVGLFALLSSEGDSHSPAPTNRTIIEATEQGWWYCASLPENRIAAVFMTDTDMIDADTEPFWRRALEQAPLTRERVRHYKLDKTPEIKSACTYISSPIADTYWLAVGDAASAWDPLSGQGICKALDDGMAAAKAIINHISGDKSAIPEFAVKLRETFDSYLSARLWFYRQETRWTQSPFWQRRSL